MKRFFIIAAVVGIGKRQHVIKAATEGEAWERFQRAYGERVCIHMRTLRPDT